jgi:agmatinase
MRRLITSGAVPGPNFVQIGLRGYWPERPVWDWMREQGMRWHLMDEIAERGFDAVMDDAIAEALEVADHLYLSVDIDAFDPAFAPATGTPEPGGLAPVDVLRMVRRLAREHRVVGMDVVELCPAYDHADVTVNLAHRLFLACLTGLAERRVRDGSPAGSAVPTEP